MVVIMNVPGRPVRSNCRRSFAPRAISTAGLTYLPQILDGASFRRRLA